MKSKVSTSYKPLYTTQKRYSLLTGSRGSAKSHHVAEFLLRLTYETGHGILFARYTMTSAETSIIPEFKKTIERLGVEDHFHITTKDIINLQTGSFVWFRGIKASSNAQKANLKSLSGVTTFVIEEGEDFLDEEAFDKVDDSIRTVNKQNRVIWIMNPSTPDHFIFKRWLKNSCTYKEFEGIQIPISTHKDVNHIHTTWRISEEYLSKSWIDKALNAKETTPKYYATNYLGAWKEKAEGAIFENWTIGEFNENLSFGFGMDFGYTNDPTTLVSVYSLEHNLYIKEHLYRTQMTTNDINKLLRDEDLLGNPIGPFCEGDPTTPLVGNPAGGTWSGTGVVANAFQPSSAGVGNYVLTYSMAGCNTTINVVVNNGPVTGPIQHY